MINTHYLVDLFSNPFSGAPILDVRAPENGQSRAQGSHVIRIPAAVSVANPTDLADLLTKKYTGLLASYPGYANIDYDDLLDATGIDPLAAGTTPRCTLGSRGNVSLLPLGGSSIQTVTTTLATIPSQVFITFEVFQWVYDDPMEDLLNRTYVEVVPSSDILVLASFNGVNFYPVTDGAALNIPPAGQGNQFFLRFQTTVSTRFWFGSWAVIY